MLRPTELWHSMSYWVTFLTVSVWGYWRQRADESLGDPPQGAPRRLYWSETMMGDPKRTPWQCTTSVCSSGALLGDLLRVSRSVKCDSLSVLSYSRFSFTFIVLSHLLGLLIILYLTIEGLLERTEHLDIFIFPPITQWCSISDVLFTDGREVSDFSVLKYY